MSSFLADCINSRGHTPYHNVPDRNSTTQNNPTSTSFVSSDNCTIQHEVPYAMSNVNMFPATSKGYVAQQRVQSGGQLNAMNGRDNEDNRRSKETADSSHSKRLKDNRLPNAARYTTESDNTAVSPGQFSQKGVHSNGHSESIENKSPKIVHYHLTIQNCDGLEIHVDNPEQKLKQTTVYSAGGQKLKRLSWIEIPSNPIDVGPSMSESTTIGTITESETTDVLPGNSEETVFISTEAESMFSGNKQVIIQEAAPAVQLTERLSYVTDTDVDSGLSGMVSRIESDSQAGESTSVVRHGSSQTEAPHQQSQYTQTTVLSRAGYTSRARQAAARRRATSPFRRNHTSDNYNSQLQDESHISSPFPHYNQFNNRGLVPHYVPSLYRPRRSRSAERDYNYGSRGIIVEEPLLNNPHGGKSQSIPISATSKGKFLFGMK